MRLLNSRNFKRLAVLIVLIPIILIGAAVIYVHSPQAKERARRYVVQTIEQRTGGATSLDRLEWDLWNQRFRLEGLTVRGLEPAGDPPLAHVESIDVGLSFRSLFQRRLDLFQLTVTRPSFRLFVDAQGKTNLPTPGQRGEGEFNFEISIEDFRIIEGLARINERRVDIDFAISNLESALRYSDTTQALNSQLQYDGVLDRIGRTSIPYRMDAELDYTRGSILAHRVHISTGNSLIKLQGRIDDVLTRNFMGRLEYTGGVETPFLNYFFPDEDLGGVADVAGQLEFSRGFFFTRGTTTTERVEFEGWTATNLRGDYTYHYPDKRLTLRNMRTAILGGSAQGSVVIENLPGDARVVLDLDYQNIDAAAVARAYPWDPKYRIYSRTTGSLIGWFEGKFDRFQFRGQANLRAYTPTPQPGIVALPVDGSTQYELAPGQAIVRNADARFFSTAIRADGLINARASNITVDLTTSDLRNLYFVYDNANGSGSFSGTLSGPISTPIADGQFTLDNHRHGEWTIQHAAGGVRLDVLEKMAYLRDVNVTQGGSALTLSGRASLDGRSVDLQLASSRLVGDDISGFIKRKVGGVLTGTAHVTSLDPLHVEGTVEATNLAIDDSPVGDEARAQIQYVAPLLELDNVTVRRGGATLTGDISYNLQSEAVRFSVRLATIDLDSIRNLGLPAGLSGVITQGQFTGAGTRSQPNVQGEAMVRNLTFLGQTFPQATIQARSNGSTINLVLNAARNLNLTAQVNAAERGFPFTARAAFDRYSVEEIIGFNQGTLVLTGRVDLAGTLTDRNQIRGSGQIETADVQIQGRSLKSGAPFNFSFDSNRLTITSVGLTGEGTAVNIAGTVGFTEAASLNLDVTGRVDLALLSAAQPEWVSAGSLTIDGRIGGTVRNPDLRGLARFNNASFGRRGIFTTLSALNGDLFFNENRITLNDLRGSVGGGTVRFQGTALIQNRQLGAMNIRIDTDDVRIRYPEGLRTVVDGALILRGSWAAPLLEGNLEIQNMAYRSEFDQFLSMLQAENLTDESSPLSGVALSIHIEGGRNISIQNELADVEARVDLDIKGTIGRPGLTGHVEVSGGTLLFQGTRYQITRGNVDFVDPLRIEPIVDIQAESDLREYRVILAVTGRGDRLRLDMRSDPPLPQLEIVSLIAGGKTGEELAQTGGAATSEELFQGGAASILFDLLKQRVGNRFGLIGLDRVRIDPFLVDADRNVARITVPLQVTKDLSIIYSQEISSSRQQIIQIEYFVSRNTSIVATRDEAGLLGLDIRQRTRF